MVLLERGDTCARLRGLRGFVGNLFWIQKSNLNDFSPDSRSNCPTDSSSVPNGGRAKSIGKSSSISGFATPADTQRQRPINCQPNFWAASSSSNKIYARKIYIPKILFLKKQFVQTNTHNSYLTYKISFRFAYNTKYLTCIIGFYIQIKLFAIIITNGYLFRVII